EAGKVVIDLGFSNYYRTSKDLRFKEGAIIEVMPAFPGGGSAPSDKIRLLPESSATEALADKRGASPESLLYTYRASVVRVLDGDTIEVVVDLGFGVRSVQTLRLRGIDCPELVSKEGQEAKEFVESVIATLLLSCDSKTQGKQSVLIKTSKSDKYDRYLADVFVPSSSLRAPEGQSNPEDYLYLNNELLEKGHAVRVSE
ncbi:MAG: thermonuclease family protein, partial [Candidatus Omnitrophica bacterium]|nr:thermonuclease family protein [Candidatus Omnitrophota bacterium]